MKEELLHQKEAGLDLGQSESCGVTVKPFAAILERKREREKKVRGIQLKVCLTDPNQSRQPPKSLLAVSLSQLS